MRMFAVATLALLALAGGGSVARADKLLVDRVEAKPSVMHDTTKVRALVSATVTGGDVVDVVRDDKKAPLLKLKVGGDPPPFLLGAFEFAEVELALVVVVPTTFAFDADFEAMRTSIDADLLDALVPMGPRVRVQIIGYGGQNLTGSKGFGRVADAKKALANLSIDADTEEKSLEEVVGHAVKLAGATLKKPKNPDALTRAAIVLVSKGMDLSLDDETTRDEKRRAITKLGEEAGTKQVRIHSFAFHPAVDDKGYHPVRPLLALGELSRRSSGTFRWIKTEGGWKPAFDQLAIEIRRQQVITFFAPPDTLDGKKLTVTMPLGNALLTSDPVAIGTPKCGREVCEGTSYCAKQVCVDRRIETGPGMVVKALIYGGVGIAAMIGLLGIIALVKRRKAAAGTPLPVATAYYGAPIASSAPAAAPAPVAVPGGPVLIILTGPATGQRLPLRHGFTVGKAAGSDLDLTHDSFASGNHAQIVFDGSTWIVHDQGSTNGTFSNGVRITQARLDPGTTVRFGSTEVRFWIG